jgi:GntR family transcriptional regulator
LPEIQEVLPKYLQIAAYIRDQIARGDLKPGDEVPSERELAETWKVARPTAARALESLRVQGLVESRQGSGTYVRNANAVPRARERYERARDLGTMYAPGESVEFLAAELADGPAHVIEALQLPAGSQVIRRVRLLRDTAGQPIELSTSWFAPQLAEQAPGLLEPERLRGGTARYLAGITGREPTYARDQVTARLANAQERRLLDLPRPAAVLVYRLTVYDAEDNPIQFDDATYPPARWVLSQEYSLPRLRIPRCLGPGTPKKGLAQVAYATYR